MTTILFFFPMLIMFIYTYREIKRLDERLDKLFCQVEQLDEMKAPDKHLLALPQIKGFNPAKPKTVLPGEGGAREVQKGAQVFEFDVKK